MYHLLDQEMGVDKTCFEMSACLAGAVCLNFFAFNGMHFPCKSSAVQIDSIFP